MRKQTTAAGLLARIRDTYVRYADQGRYPATPITPFINPQFFTSTISKERGMFTITKDFHFSASHVLSGLPDGHPCGRLHGHNFIVRLHLESDELNEVGFVVDYRDLAGFSDWLDEQFDHRHLNARVEFNPTAENMCRYLYDVARHRFDLPVSAVSWSETPKTWATYTPTGAERA